MKTTYASVFNQLRHHIPLSGAGGGRDLEVHQQPMPIFHERLTHVAEASFLAWTFATQPRIRIGGALMGGIRALLAVEVHPSIARTAAVRTRRRRRFVLGSK